MYNPGKSKEVLFEEKRSKFYSRCWYVETVDAANRKLSELRSLNPTASHIVYAYIVGMENSTTMGMSDDGEPKGTSGRPTLEVVKGSGFTNILLTTVRYFGGTKLGTGGLVRAYTAAAQLAIEACSRILIRDLKHIEIVLPYELFDKVKRYLSERYIEELSESFAESVRMNFKLEVDALDGFRDFLQDISNGAIHIE